MKKSYYDIKIIMFFTLLLVLLYISGNLYAECGSVVLWNKLGSDQEVLTSEIGPNLEFYDPAIHGGTACCDETGNRAYIAGPSENFGSGVMLSGSYGMCDRIHNIILNNLSNYINPEKGTIEVWYMQTADPVAYSHDIYRIFDGPFGLNSGMTLQSDDANGLIFGLYFGGTYTYINYNISAYNNTWIHIAAVWDRAGIDGSSYTMRLYVNGDEVADTTENNWGTTVGNLADICGANDAAGYFSIDNLMIWDSAKTDFSDRFSEPPYITSPVLSGVENDPTDPAKILGIDLTISDPNATVTATKEAVHDQSGVKPFADPTLELTGGGTAWNLKITPKDNTRGYAIITVKAIDSQGNTDATFIHYAASTAANNPDNARFHTGASDASAAIAIDENYMFVGNDEDEVIRLYDRNNSGFPIATFDFHEVLDVVKEVDIEASTRVDDRIYWIGSHGNDREGNPSSDRNRLFATRISGSGASVTMDYVGRYDGLRDDLQAWGDVHGYDFTESMAPGKIPIGPDGFNIEGLTIAPDNTTAYIAFRAPLVPVSNRTKALIAPVNNLSDLVSDNPSSGPAQIGDPIELDLGGLPIRSIERNSSNQYLIIAGGPGDENNFQLFTWTGNPEDTPQLRITNPDLITLNEGQPTGGYESFLIPDNLNGGALLHLLVDNGRANWYGDDPSVQSKKLHANFQKFRRDEVMMWSIPITVTRPDDPDPDGCYLDDCSLREAIIAANVASGPDVIDIPPGTYTLKIPGQWEDTGLTGDLDITDDLVITGRGSAESIIDGGGLDMVLHIIGPINIELLGLTIQNGIYPGAIRGGGFQVGSEVDTLTISNCRISDNDDIGINAVGDTLEVNNTTISGNRQGINASVRNIEITSSTISGNALTGISEDHVCGNVMITNTTIANNGGCGIFNDGSAASVSVINSTLSGNVIGIMGQGLQPAAEIQNSIIAGNQVNCSGVITSLGNNLIGNVSVQCDIDLLASDIIGDPGLCEFIDDGTPGNGHFPLHSYSPAIDAGNNLFCPETDIDQLGTSRLVDGNGDGIDVCDIGAIEYIPIVNDLVFQLEELLTTSFNPDPVLNAPAGTFTITVTFTNTSSSPDILNPFFKVVELSGDNLLLNADGGAGGLGATLTPDVGDDGILSPGESFTVDFVIGFQTRNRLRFFVDLLGVPGT